LACGEEDLGTDSSLLDKAKRFFEGES